MRAPVWRLAGARQRATMALNAASHNPSNVQLQIKHPNCLIPDNTETAGEKTGPVSGPPPSASIETTAAILEASKDDSTGQHEGSRGNGDQEAPKKIKSEKGRM